MALNRWLGAALIVSVLGFAGCTEQKKDPTADNAPPVAATTAPVETAETPVATDVATDAGTTPAEPASAEAIDADLENAEGMAGYDEVLAMTVPPSTPELVAQGKEVYATNCASCHGDTGHGDGPVGVNLDPPPRELTHSGEYKYGHLAKAVYRTAAYGIEGTGMAPLGDVIEPDDMWAVVHYVETLKK